MHQTLQTILMVRDRDLRRWGRPVAVMMFCFSVFCFGAAVTGRWVIEAQIAPKMRYVTDQESKFLEKHADSDDAVPIRRAISARRRADEGILEAARAGIWIFVGLGLLAFSHGAVLWRACDLASSESTVAADFPQRNPNAEQAAVSARDKPHV